MTQRKIVEGILLFLIALNFAHLLVFGIPQSVTYRITMVVLLIATTFYYYVLKMTQDLDEVQISDTKNSWALGTGIGLSVAIVSAVIVRYIPEAAAFIVYLAALPESTLPTAAVGFGYGIGFVVVLIMIASYAVAAYWWLARRSNPQGSTSDEK